MAKISVLIPTYKNSIELKETIESLIHGEKWFFEIIIGDDGGDEGTLRLVEEYQQQNLPFRHLLPVEGGCLTANIKRMVTIAEGEWIYLIHHDDRWVGLSEETFRWFENPSIDFVFTDHWVISEEGERLEEYSIQTTIDYGRNTLENGSQKEILALGILQRICLDGFFIRKECAHGIEVDRKHFINGDWLWLLKALGRCRSVMYSKERSFEYRLSKRGLTSMGCDRSFTLEMLLEVEGKSSYERTLLEIKKSELASSACWDYLLKGEYGKSREVIQQGLHPVRYINRLKLLAMQWILYFPNSIVRVIVSGLCIIFPKQKQRRL